MGLVPASALDDFRSGVRSWLQTHVPAEPAPSITRDGIAHRDFLRGWQRKLHDSGWAGINWPSAFGGRDLGAMEQIVWFEEYARAGGPDCFGLSVAQSHAGPTLIQAGTPEQRAFHLPRILSGEAIWCQGFSEPGAGSDLAGIRCRGDVEGDEIVVNGSKIWTSFAQAADYQELVLRTEPGSQRHKGLSWVICDMQSPGITVRPIKSMDGEYHNCEVFYDNLRIPLSNVVGKLGDGWRVSMATLAFERGRSFIGSQVRLLRTVERLLDFARDTNGSDGEPLIADPSIATRLGELRARASGLKSMTYFSVARSMNDEVPGAEGTYVALMLAELKQQVYRLWMELLDMRGLEVTDVPHATNPVLQYLFSFAATIGGGTSEVRRNIIAERILGLPRHDAVAELPA
ncbi:MAG: acyl-CoA dehydrogenase family protein [Novosphingobium sp.]|nr:acyl-CoA dehydrogenase family protein [Novosphingobium sp.]